MIDVVVLIAKERPGNAGYVKVLVVAGRGPLKMTINGQ